MRRIRYSIGIAALAVAVSGFAQVVSPPEISDVRMRELQQTHLADLKAVGVAISAHPFPYQLYFSRTLDLDESQQGRSDQRSIRFDKFRNQTVVEITANYYASYSAELMQREQRVRRTLDDVIVPKPVDGWGCRESQFMAETQVRLAAKPVSEPGALSAIV